MRNELIKEMEILKEDLIRIGYTQGNPNVVEVIDDVITELSDKSNLKYVGIVGGDGGNIETMHRAMEMAQEHDIILAMPDFPERGNIAMDDPIPFMLTRHDVYEDFHIIDINDGAKSGTNPQGRKAGNSKKRRKR
jgi:hypothetical protein